MILTDVEWHLLDFLEADGSQEVTVTLHKGINLLHIEEAISRLLGVSLYRGKCLVIVDFYFPDY